MAPKTNRQSNYLRALVDESGNKAAAGRLTEVPKATYSRWFASDQDFKLRSEEILPKVEHALLEECIRRALDKSDVLMMFLLKSLRPSRYDDNFRRAIAEKQHNDSISIDMPTQQSKSLTADAMKEIDPFVNYFK